MGSISETHGLVHINEILRSYLRSQSSLLLLKWVSLATVIQVHITHGHIYLTSWVHVVIITNTVLSKRSSVNGLFQLSVRLLLYCLSVLQFLDQLHFQHFHLHHFSLFLLDDIFFFDDLTLYFLTGRLVLLSPILFNLGFLDPFLLFLQLIFQVIFLCELMH